MSLTVEDIFNNIICRSFKYLCFYDGRVLDVNNENRVLEFIFGNSLFKYISKKDDSEQIEKLYEFFADLEQGYFGNNELNKDYARRFIRLIYRGWYDGTPNAMVARYRNFLGENQKGGLEQIIFKTRENLYNNLKYNLNSLIATRIGSSEKKLKDNLSNYIDALLRENDATVDGKVKEVLAKIQENLNDYSSLMSITNSLVLLIFLAVYRIKFNEVTKDLSNAKDYCWQIINNKVNKTVEQMIVDYINIHRGDRKVFTVPSVMFSFYEILKILDNYAWNKSKIIEIGHEISKVLANAMYGDEDTFQTMKELSKPQETKLKEEIKELENEYRDCICYQDNKDLIIMNRWLNNKLNNNEEKIEEIQINTYYEKQYEEYQNKRKMVEDALNRLYADWKGEEAMNEIFEEYAMDIIDFIAGLEQNGTLKDAKYFANTLLKEAEQKFPPEPYTVSLYKEVVKSFKSCSEDEYQMLRRQLGEDN